MVMECASVIQSECAHRQCTMDPYHAGPVLARGNRFRRSSLEFITKVSTPSGLNMATV